MVALIAGAKSFITNSQNTLLVIQLSQITQEKIGPKDSQYQGKVVW